jgi:hypothetical protein
LIIVMNSPIAVMTSGEVIPQAIGIHALAGAGMQIPHAYPVKMAHPEYIDR